MDCGGAASPLFDFTVERVGQVCSVRFPFISALYRSRRTSRHAALGTYVSRLLCITPTMYHTRAHVSVAAALPSRSLRTAHTLLTFPTLPTRADHALSLASFSFAATEGGGPFGALSGLGLHLAESGRRRGERED